MQSAHYLLDQITAVVEVERVEGEPEGCPQEDVKEQDCLIAEKLVTEAHHHDELNVDQQEQYPHQNRNRDGDAVVNGDGSLHGHNGGLRLRMVSGSDGVQRRRAGVAIPAFKGG